MDNDQVGAFTKECFSQSGKEKRNKIRNATDKRRLVKPGMPHPVNRHVIQYFGPRLPVVNLFQIEIGLTANDRYVQVVNPRCIFT